MPGFKEFNRTPCFLENNKEVFHKTYKSIPNPARQTDFARIASNLASADIYDLVTAHHTETAVELLLEMKPEKQKEILSYNLLVETLYRSSTLTDVHKQQLWKLPPFAEAFARNKFTAPSMPDVPTYNPTGSDIIMTP
ncbi:MAG: hypothetical protein WCD70_15640 [Alphaproteobacteria bacterium]